MRSGLAGLVAIATSIAACGGFGEAEGENDTPPPGNPDDNAKAPPDPVDGKPIAGIYVSSSRGQAGRTGFPGSPVSTIKEGLARAKAENLRLIVCAEEYAENIEIVDGVSAYGYYDCSVEPWVRITKRAVVKAPASPAIVGRDIKLATRIEGFEIIAPDLDATTAIDRSGSSIGAEVRNIAPNILFFSDSILRGGKAAAGAEGVPAGAPNPMGTFVGTVGIDGSSSNCTAAMIACSNMAVPGVLGPAPTCGDEAAPAPGGNGGDGMWFIEHQPHPQANNDQRGRPFTASATVAAGGNFCGTPDTTNGCGQGGHGAKGGSGSAGSTGAWTFDAEGFVLGQGTRGSTGGPGQSGGGGGGADLWCFGPQSYGNPPSGGTGYFRSARGGSGGAGGCGGLAGGGGGGGGASIGVIALDAPVVLERVTVEGSNGGRSGAGTFGGAGSAGGAGAAGGLGAGKGGNGGQGGLGGASGHGAAGPSIALVFRGSRPALNGGSELKPGAGGEGRPQATDSGRTIPASPVGQSIAEYEIKPTP